MTPFRCYGYGQRVHLRLGQEYSSPDCSRALVPLWRLLELFDQGDNLKILLFRNAIHTPSSLTRFPPLREAASCAALPTPGAVVT